jgi:hypothetical protein
MTTDPAAEIARRRTRRHSTLIEMARNGEAPT